MRAKGKKMLTDMIADVLERHGGFRFVGGCEWACGDVRVRRGGGQSMLSNSRTVAILSDTGDDIADFWRVMDTVSTLLRHAELDTQSHN